MSDETPQVTQEQVPAESPPPEPTPESLGWEVPDLGAEMGTPPPPEEQNAPETPLPDTWGNPEQVAMEMIRQQQPAPTPQPYVPPQPSATPPTGEPEFDMELAQTDFAAAQKKYAREFTAFVNKQFEERDRKAEAQAIGARVAYNLQEGGRIHAEVIAHDPAMRDPRVAEVTRVLILEAQKRAFTPDGFKSTEAFTNPTFHRALINTAKDIVAQERGQQSYQGPPVAQNMGGARVLSPRQGSGAPPPSIILSADEKAYLAARRIPEAEYIKNKMESERERAANEPWRR